MVNLFSNFSSLTLENWKKEIEKSLKGITFNELSQQDENGILINPTYTSENSPITNSPLFYHHDWTICSEINVQGEKNSNKLALNELRGGAAGLNFTFLAENCRGQKQKSLEIILNEILIEHIRTNFTFTHSATETICELEKIITQRQIDPNLLNGFFCYDTLNINPTENALKEWEEFCSSNLFKKTNYSPFCFDISKYQNIGSNSVIELSCFVLQLNEYLNFCANNKISLGTKEIVIIASTGSTFFETVSKLRAIRKLFKLLTKQYGITNSLYLHCKNTRINKSTLDVDNNLLRSATEGMASVIGGANSLTIYPFNNSIIENDLHARRLALNQQLIFKEEALLNKVADIGAGSYYIETLSSQLAENAWEIFKALETEGGFIACMQNGFIPELINASSVKQQNDFNSGKKVLVGVNKFRNEKEKVYKRHLEIGNSKFLILGKEIEETAKRSYHA